MMKILSYFLGIVIFVMVLMLLGGIFNVVDEYLLNGKYFERLDFVREYCNGGVIGFLCNSDEVTKKMRDNSEGLHHILFALLVTSALLSYGAVLEIQKSHERTMAQIRSKYNKNKRE